MGYNRNLDRQNAVGETWWQRNWSLVMGPLIALAMALGFAWAFIP